MLLLGALGSLVYVVLNTLGSGDGDGHHKNAQRVATKVPVIELKAAAGVKGGRSGVYNATGDGGSVGGDEREAHAVWRIDEQLELNGFVVRWGQNATSATACQADCDAMQSKNSTCNIFVFCDAADGCGSMQHGSCWLKKQDIRRDGMPATMSRGRGVGWTSGVRVSPQEIEDHAQRERARAANALQMLRSRYPDIDKRMDVRACGSPASDAYASVNASCLLESPTAVAYEMARLEAVVNNRGANDWALAASCNLEEHVSLDGVAVAWGLTNKMDSAAACCDACRTHVAGKGHGPFSRLPCNAWVWCPEETCFEPDAHQHTKGDCWLKFTELPHRPEVNQRGQMPASYLQRHPNAPNLTQWFGGVILLPGIELTNGTWSPRADWR